MFHLDYSQPLLFLFLVFILFFIILFRYVLAAGGFYLYFYLWKPKQYQKRKLNDKRRDPKQLKFELKWSFITSLIFAVTGALAFVAWQQGYTLVYEDIGKYGWFYFFFSIGIYMFIHETYYYWLHRWMHKPAIFKKVHKIHHDSIITSPWTAFSFHPLEGLIEALIIPFLIFILPIHYYALLIHLSIMTVSSVINHLDIEIYPKGFHKNWFGKWWIGATHHSLHHRQYRYNYGLYFTFWDKWMKTESPQFYQRFEEKTN